jgi:hypothetical protein
MAIDMRLVRKGKSEPITGLVRQGEAHVALGKQYAEALIESGWASEDTAELEKNVALLKSKRLPGGGADDDNVVDHEATAVGDAKIFIRRLHNALPRALRETTAAEVSPDVFESGERLGRSVKTISAYLTKIRSSVEKLDGDLMRHFGGKKASEALDKVSDALTTVTEEDGAQGTDTEETLSYYELKGRVLEGIEDLNRAGRIAFEGQGEVVGKFNKDILLRARRERSSRPSGSGSASEGGGWRAA